jgi:hypothetical protein
MKAILAGWRLVFTAPLGRDRASAAFACTRRAVADASDAMVAAVVPLTRARTRKARQERRGRTAGARNGIAGIGNMVNGHARFIKRDLRSAVQRA